MTVLNPRNFRHSALPMVCLVFGLAALFRAADGTAQAAEPVPPSSAPLTIQPNDRVVFVGSAFVERMNERGYFEAALQASHADTPFSFRNLGWSGDNVWGDARAVFGGRPDGFKRLVNDTLATKPTVIMLCYGENEAYAGEAGLNEFKHGYETLLAALAPAKARLVLIAPRQHENLGPPLPSPQPYNESLAKYCDAIRELATTKGLAFVDLYDALLPTSPGNAPALTDNGLHLTAFGERQLANELVRRLTGRSLGWSVKLDAPSGKFQADRVLASDLERQAQDVKFVLSAMSLPLSSLGNIESAGSAEQKLQLAGLAAGKYELKFDGEAVGKFTHEQLATGVDVAIPAAQQRADELKRLIVKKNELYFHRYRPQNETYLFLFRKHEQGNNAVEISQFDPLVEELDQQIIKAKGPMKSVVELKLSGS